MKHFSVPKPPRISCVVSQLKITNREMFLTSFSRDIRLKFSGGQEDQQVVGPTHNDSRVPGLFWAPTELGELVHTARHAHSISGQRESRWRLHRVVPRDARGEGRCEFDENTERFVFPFPSCLLQFGTNLLCNFIKDCSINRIYLVVPFVSFFHCCDAHFTNSLIRFCNFDPFSVTSFCQKPFLPPHIKLVEFHRPPSWFSVSHHFYQHPVSCLIEIRWSFHICISINIW